jgi:hypothetical protein
MASCGAGCCRVVDFGWPLDEDTPNWPTVCAVRRRVLSSGSSYFDSGRLASLALVPRTTNKWLSRER